MLGSILWRCKYFDSQLWGKHSNREPSFNSSPATRISEERYAYLWLFRHTWEWMHITIALWNCTLYMVIYLHCTFRNFVFREPCTISQQNLFENKKMSNKLLTNTHEVIQLLRSALFLDIYVQNHTIYWSDEGRDFKGIPFIIER